MGLESSSQSPCEMTNRCHFAQEQSHWATQPLSRLLPWMAQRVALCTSHQGPKTAKNTSSMGENIQSCDATAASLHFQEREKAVPLPNSHIQVPILVLQAKWSFMRFVIPSLLEAAKRPISLFQISGLLRLGPQAVGANSEWNMWFEAM